MRILFIHNFYRSDVPSGENAVVEAEIQMLRNHGHTVEIFRRSNDSIRHFFPVGVVLSMLTMIANPVAAIQLYRRVRHFKPDVVHIHNLFPLISPLVLLSLRNVPVVMTLHNYRLFCVGETVCYDGKPCTLCLQHKSVFPGLKRHCYRGSLWATIPLSCSIALYRMLGFWGKRIARYVVFTKFQRDLIASCGISEDLLVIKPNHVSEVVKIAYPWHERENRVVYVGRISKEKGCDVLIQAWNKLGDGAPRLEIIGTGQDVEKCQRMCNNSHVTFSGRQPKSYVFDRLSHSKMLILPSVCYEGLPTTVIESYMCGTPVLVSDLGPLPSVVTKGRQGMLFAAGDPDDLAEKLQLMWNDQVALEKMGGQARKCYLDKYTEEVNYQNQMAMYEDIHSNRYLNREDRRMCN